MYLWCAILCACADMRSEANDMVWLSPRRFFIHSVILLISVPSTRVGMAS